MSGATGKGVLVGLNKGEFEMRYRPQYRIVEDRIYIDSSEARLVKVSGGSEEVCISEYGPVPKRKRIESRLGMDVIREVIRKQKKWNEDGITIRRVNIPVRSSQLEDKYFSCDVRKELNNVKLDAKYIGIVIVGELGATNEEEVRKNINGLRKLGVEVVVDGIEHEIPGWLEYDVVKISEHRVLCIHRNNNLGKVMETIKFANSKGKKVISEGIETEELLCIVNRLGCNVFQGNLFSGDVDEERYKEMLRGKGEHVF